MKIALLGCSYIKSDMAGLAKDVYIGQLFKMSYKYAQQRCDKILILSAKHGVITPDTWIEPYNATLNNMSVVDRKKWSKKVMSQLRNHITIYDTLIFFCGKNYYFFLSQWLPNNALYPLSKLAIGCQLKYLKEVTK